MPEAALPALFVVAIFGVFVVVVGGVSIWTSLSSSGEGDEES